jgi:hypothetical protein
MNDMQALRKLHANGWRVLWDSEAGIGVSMEHAQGKEMDEDELRIIKEPGNLAAIERLVAWDVEEAQRVHSQALRYVLASVHSYYKQAKIMNAFDRRIAQAFRERQLGELRRHCDRMMVKAKAAKAKEMA